MACAIAVSSSLLVAAAPKVESLQHLRIPS